MRFTRLLHPRLAQLKRLVLNRGLLSLQLGITFAELALPLSFAVIATLCEGTSLFLLGILLQLFLTGQGQASPPDGMATVAAIADFTRFWPQGSQTGFVVALLVLTMIGRIVFQYFSATLTIRTVRNLGNNLRKRLFERYLAFGKLFHDRNSSGHLHQMLTLVTDNISSQISRVNSLVIAALTLTVYFAILSRTSWQLTLLCLLIFPALKLSTERVLGRLRISSHALNTTYADLGRTIQNSLTCIPLVKSYNNEEVEKRWFFELSDDVTQIQYSIDRNSLMIGPIRDLILFGAVGIIVIVLLMPEVHGAGLNFGKGIMFIMVLRRASGQFGAFSSFRAQIASVEGYLGDIRKVFSDEDKFIVPEGTLEFTGLKSELHFDNLSYSFPGSTQILHGVSFSFEKGKMTAIVGKSGAGKSTLINLIMRFYDSPPGTIIADGVDVRDFTLRSWRSKLALVSQDTYLFNSSLRTNLIYGLNRPVGDEELFETLLITGLGDFIRSNKDGLATRVGDRGITLSGGERQRLSIARAILKRPEIVILDEATSALDSITERAIQLVVENRWAGNTLIVIAHRLSTIRQAHRVVVLEEGRVVEFGAPEDLRPNKGQFFRLWQEQNKG